MTDESPDARDAAHEVGFAVLGLGEPLLTTRAGLGYEEPTPIQREAIPLLLAGRDLLAEAPTGTGKTAAFALPVLAGLPVGRAGPGRASALVVVPTRELAMQVAEAFHSYGKVVDVQAAVVDGVADALRGARIRGQQVPVRRGRPR